jgi:hypothetical protein
MMSSEDATTGATARGSRSRSVRRIASSRVSGDTQARHQHADFYKRQQHQVRTVETDGGDDVGVNSALF